MPRPEFLPTLLLLVVLAEIGTPLADTGACSLLVRQPIAEPAWESDGFQFEARFGHAVANAGDVNGDGFSDVIVGAIFYDAANNDSGRASVFHGSTDGLSLDPDWTVDGPRGNALIGWSLAAAGDINGDGYDDVIVGSPSAGDVLPQFGSGGAAFVYYGSPVGLSKASALKISSTQPGESLGRDVSAAGDVNGDGYDDVIIGAPRSDNGEGDEGRAYLYYGSSTGLSREAGWSGESDMDLGWFGLAVAAAGDIDRDGYDDFIVGSPGWSETHRFQGAVLVYFGSPNGPDQRWIYTGDGASQLIGHDVASAGDVNGDGYPDVLISSRTLGLAAVFHGSSNGLATKPDWRVRNKGPVSPTNPGDERLGRTPLQIRSIEFGESVATAGDFNGDGFDDVLIGAPDFSNGEEREGAAFLYLGSPAGLSRRPMLTVEGNKRVANLGYSVGGGGDVNGDGYSDFIVGAFGYTNTLKGEGAAFVFHGSCTEDTMARAGNRVRSRD